MKAPTTNYRIIGLEVNNIKRLRAVRILPTKNVVSIGGRNDQGKSSILDAILFAMAGNASVCEKPIRTGATQGDITVDLGDMIITKKFKQSSEPTLKVTMKDGTPVKTPQAILDALCDKISYDPMEFVTMKPDKRLDMLRKLVGIDFTELNGKRLKAYEERTLVNRELVQAKAKLATSKFHEDAPATEVSVAELMKQFSAANDANAVNAQARLLAKNAQTFCDNHQTKIQDAKQEIQQIKELLATKEAALVGFNTYADTLAANATTLKAKADALVDTDTNAISEQIAAADNTNAKVRGNTDHKALLKQVADFDSKSMLFDVAIAQIDQSKQDLLKAAKFPLPELSFDDSGVLLDDEPFEQAGMAKKIIASVSIGIALHPKLRVQLIRDGSLLDDENMALLDNLAEKENLQIWIERVGQGAASVIVEDGSLKEA